MLERLSPQRPNISDSPAHDYLIDKYEKADSNLLSTHDDDENEVEPIDQFTYWEGETAIMLDRFFTSR